MTSRASCRWMLHRFGRRPPCEASQTPGLPLSRESVGEHSTQFEQCERYVQAEWERDRARLDLDGRGDLPWRAILTDGRVWWMWQWGFRYVGGDSRNGGLQLHSCLIDHLMIAIAGLDRTDFDTTRDCDGHSPPEPSVMQEAVATGIISTVTTLHITQSSFFCP